MVDFVSFKELKTRVSMLQVMQVLGLRTTEKNGNHRCACPTCEGGPRTLSITPAEGVFRCFASGKAGDFISLAAHVLNVSMRDAAVAIDKHFPASAQVAPTPPARAEPPPVAQPTPKHPATAPSELQGQLEKVRARLDFGHEILGMMGFPEIVWRTLGIGYDPRSKRIMYPLYKDGQLVGYAGLATDEGQSPLMLFHRNLVTICAPQAEEKKPDASRFLRVVK